MIRLDDCASENYKSAAIYGRSGTGKTSFGVTAPKPLICLMERQGMVHVRQAAARLGIVCPPTALCESIGDLRAIAAACLGDKRKPFRAIKQRKTADGKTEDEVVLTLTEWPETVVVDSMTEAGRLMVESIDREAPPIIGKDGLPAHSQNYWGVLRTRFGNLVRTFRSLPMHKIFLALEDDKEFGEEGNKSRWVGPSLPMRALADELTSAVNVVGRTYRRVRIVNREGRKETQITYGVLTVGPEYAITKPYRPLRDSEVPNFSEWCRIIDGSLVPGGEGVPLPGEMDPGGEELVPEEKQQEQVQPAPKEKQQEPAPKAGKKTSKKVGV